MPSLHLAGLALGLASTFVVPTPSTPSTKPVGTVRALRGDVTMTHRSTQYTHWTLTDMLRISQGSLEESKIIEGFASFSMPSSFFCSQFLFRSLALICARGYRQHQFVMKDRINSFTCYRIPFQVSMGPSALLQAQPWKRIPLPSAVLKSS